MKYLILIALIISAAVQVNAQSNSTQDLHEKYEDAFTMFFYKNTLKMLRTEENEEFNKLIKGIEKAKLLRIEKDYRFKEQDLENYMKGIKRESFEEVMTVRQRGNKINVYLKERKGNPVAVILLMDTEEGVSILDIEGMIDLNKVTTLTKEIDF